MEAKGVKWHGGIKQTISVPIDKAWEIYGNFCAVDTWVKTIEQCDVIEGDHNKPGCVRYVTGNTFSQGGGKNWAKEKLLSIDEDKHSLSYTLLDSSLGLVGYVSYFKLQDLNDGTILVDWSYETDPVENRTEDQVAALVSSIYKVGVRDLEDKVKSQSSS